jgi:hypothetical protein
MVLRKTAWWFQDFLTTDLTCFSDPMAYSLPRHNVQTFLFYFPLGLHNGTSLPYENAFRNELYLRFRDAVACVTFQMLGNTWHGITAWTFYGQLITPLGLEIREYGRRDLSKIWREKVISFLFFSYFPQEVILQSHLDLRVPGLRISSLTIALNCIHSYGL